MSKKSDYKKAFKPVILKMKAPQLIKQVIYPTSTENKFIGRILHPNTQKVLWEKKYSKGTDINKIFSEANDRYERLKLTEVTWVRGTEEDEEETK